ncbi:hypothetical protein F5X99DRAFT_403498 [Biscogniauxia marginata]|nr:hypothetical protein F5X99DRAFT_403498 [Biscogniauxia marginata]
MPLPSRTFLISRRRLLATSPLFSHPAAPPPLRRRSSTFEPGPSPPRLSVKEQAEFERLQRNANTQEGFNPSATSPEISSAKLAAHADVELAAATTVSGEEAGGVTGAPLRKGAPPEFEGDVNPRTGEVGGPKNEPLRWGPDGDYSFNGRVTDF